MDFPTHVSFTLTNACNLRCRMCGQWSAEGYMHGDGAKKPAMTLADWKRLVDEIAEHRVGWLLLRGGEPFLMPGMVELLDYIAGKGIFVGIDTNGTRLAPFVDDLVRIGKVHLTISVDGPEAIHDSVRGVPGCYGQIAAALGQLRQAERRTGVTTSKGISFAISPWSYRGLGAMPEVARSLGIGTLCIVPYFYIPEALGRTYETEMRDEMGCHASSWRGFHHDTSGIDFEVFSEQLRAYRASLGSITDYPYLPLSEEEYRTWFEDPAAVVCRTDCPSIERLVDIQPTGEANFCVDYPDYSIGNVREATIASLWNGERARRFRERRRQKPFAACHRCGAKYMTVERA